MASRLCAKPNYGVRLCWDGSNGQKWESSTDREE